MRPANRTSRMTATDIPALAEVVRLEELALDVPVEIERGRERERGGGRGEGEGEGGRGREREGEREAGRVRGIISDVYCNMS